MEKQQPINIYFPGLNGLRFIAAMLVFICHVEAVKNNFNLPNHFDNYFFSLIGKLGVVLFFVLSGFLISYLLLSELNITKTIKVKRFYLRRILRIWPLYFLIILFSLFLAPNLSFFHLPKVDSALDTTPLSRLAFLFFFILPNYLIATTGVVPYAAQTWSIGTEEQFYLIWPVLIKKIKNKLLLFIAVFILYNLIKLLLIMIQEQGYVFKALLDFWYYFNIDCMAIGALGAYLVFAKKEKILSIIYSIPVQIITYGLLIYLLSFTVVFRYLHFEIYSTLFIILIINMASNKKSMLVLENPVLNYLGKISYGIYMYQFIALTAAIKILMYFNFANSTAIYLVGFIFTIILSSLSYHYFESFFLKQKMRFSVFPEKK